MYDWETLKSTCHSCTKCGLCETRHNVVFGIGVKNADVMFVGEGPGEQEDLKGEPFVRSLVILGRSFQVKACVRIHFSLREGFCQCVK